MKKRFINRLAAFILFAMMGVNLFSQGFYVYTKDGQRQDFPSENVDSIVFYEKIMDDIEPEVPDVPGKPDTPTPGEAIDLGLSVKWASHNVSASSPEGYGGYYAWGETEEKSDYSRDTYKWYNSNTLDYVNIGSNISGTQYDVAHVKWGGSWRMPTRDERIELVNNCTWKWTSYNGVNGQLVTGPNGNSIFLPAAGISNGTDLDYRGLTGYYWFATLCEFNSGRAYALCFNDGYDDYNIWLGRRNGFTVRPVTE